MKLVELFEKKSCVYALEVFPPKKETGIAKLQDTLQNMAQTRPDYISVTYSAGGGGNREYTLQIARHLQQMGVEALAHLTCTGARRAEIAQRLADMQNAGVRNILALRGDRQPGHPLCRDYAHASDLMLEIKGHGGFYIAGACYPEGHPESGNVQQDVERLKAKTEAGAGHLVSQLFFDNGKFYRFLNLARKCGIHCPIEAGVMPIVRKEQIERTISLSSASLPSAFSKMVSRYAHDPHAFYEAGLAYAIEQIRDLIEGGVDGIHLYAMNNADVARRVRAGIDDLL